MITSGQPLGLVAGRPRPGGGASDVRHAITGVVAASLMVSGCANALGARAPHAGGQGARATRSQPAAMRAGTPAPTRANTTSKAPAPGRPESPHQMVTVVAASYGATYATLSAYHRAG